MKWAERLPLVAVFLGAVALWLPWVGHSAAALVLTGLDLPEFVRFMGEYRSGALPVQPLLFAAPIVALALAGSAYAAHWRLSFWGRVVAVGACLWLPTVPFPPLERRRELLVAVVAVLAAHAALSAIRASPRLLALLASAVAGVAAALPIWQFLVMVPALNRLYGRPVAFGAGVYLEALAGAAGIVLGAVLVVAAIRRRSSAPPATPA